MQGVLHQLAAVQELVYGVVCHGELCRGMMQR
jgi:hypothetical protein